MEGVWTSILLRAGEKVADCFAAEVVDVGECGGWVIEEVDVPDVEVGRERRWLWRELGGWAGRPVRMYRSWVQVEETVLFGEMVGKVIWWKALIRS